MKDRVLFLFRRVLRKVRLASKCLTVFWCQTRCGNAGLRQGTRQRVYVNIANQETSAKRSKEEERPIKRKHEQKNLGRESQVTDWIDCLFAWRHCFAGKIVVISTHHAFFWRSSW